MKWQRRHIDGYEVSSKGDKRFSALFARMPDGRTIEQWYQCDIKGYDIGGTNWQAGKGQPSLINWTADQLWEHYLSLWRLWAIHNNDALMDLFEKSKGKVLTDMFANTTINQARALAQIITEWLE